MTPVISEPDSGVQSEVGNTQLTYVSAVDPSPLTASAPAENPLLGSIRVVITNANDTALAVTSITFGIPVGAAATSLTPTTAGIQTLVSDTVHWSFSGPPAPVTSGIADYVLEPVTGAAVTLDAGGSVSVHLYGLQTNTTPGTASIIIEEVIGASPAANGGFTITTFPYGFYFNSLAATVPMNGNMVPVAQVANSSTVTLTWNGSVTDPTAYAIYYSTPQGPASAIPTTPNQWQSPSLQCDTVFTVVVSPMVAGEPVTASLSTCVSVSQPDLNVNSISIAGTQIASVQPAEANQPAGTQLNATTITGETVNVTSLCAGLLNTLGEEDTVGVLGNVTINGLLTLCGDLALHGSLTVDKNLTMTDGVLLADGHTLVSPPTSTGNSVAAKTLIIDHPLDRERFLVHATVEGPETAVFYRGSARLDSGRAEIVLPHYFEALCDANSATILLTEVDGFDRLCIKTSNGLKICAGRFVVVSDNPASTQSFDWEVKAMRRDAEGFEVEPLKTDIAVCGYGPYRYASPSPTKKMNRPGFNAHEGR